MTETPATQPITLPAFTMPADVALRLAVLAAVADVQRAKPMLGGIGPGAALDVIDAITLGDWVLTHASGPTTTFQGQEDDPEPVAESPTTDDVNAMLREAAAEQRNAKGPRPFQEDDVVTINPGALRYYGDEVEAYRTGPSIQWTVTNVGAPGVVLDGDGELRLEGETDAGRAIQYVLPEGVTLVTPNITPEPEPRPWQVGDVVRVAEGAKFTSASGDPYPTDSAGRDVIIVSLHDDQDNDVTVGRTRTDARWSVMPQFLTLVTPAAVQS